MPYVSQVKVLADSTAKQAAFKPSLMTLEGLHFKNSATWLVPFRSLCDVAVLQNSAQTWEDS